MMSRLVPAAVTLLFCIAAQAQSLKDPQWDALLEAGRTAELESLAQARLQAQPDDVQAPLAIALAAMNGTDAARIDAALKRSEQCRQRQPAAAACHYAAGALMGVQAMTGGLFKAMGLSGRIRESLTKAVELDPLYFNAREGLLQFYLLAPSVAGGGVGKARDLADAAQARQPEHTRVLRARIAMHEEKWAEAERELAAVRPGDDSALRTAVRGAWADLGGQYVRAKEPAKARAVFERLQREHPAFAIGSFGLAYVLADSGANDEAIPWFERARGLQGADGLPIDYSLGLAWLAKGDKARAKSLLERFVAQGKGHPQTVETARKRLAELG